MPSTPTHVLPLPFAERTVAGRGGRPQQIALRGGPPVTANSRASNASQVGKLLRAYYEGQAHLRRGICLLNAGAYDQAAQAFTAASAANPDHAALPRYLAASLIGSGDHAGAAALFEQELVDRPDSAVQTIRCALAQWKSGRSQAAVATLRDALRRNSGHVELHFQLGTLLAALDEFEEAELRFTQAVNLAPDHVDALVGLALCRALHQEPRQALKYLLRAQLHRPQDAHVALLLTQAAKTAGQQGAYLPLMAAMPPEDAAIDERAIAELSVLIEREPDFVDAFLSLPAEQMDDRVFVMLAATLEQALKRQPEHADLHYHCGRVLARLGRPAEAIAETERAVQIKPRFVQALIQLAKLYQQTDRLADATTRLEQALQLGVEYADVYYLLGDLYRSSGQIQRARGAYTRALCINERYEAAREALLALPA